MNWTQKKLLDNKHPCKHNYQYCSIGKIRLILL